MRGAARRLSGGLLPGVPHGLEAGNLFEVSTVVTFIPGGCGLLGPALYFGNAGFVLGDQRVTQ